MKKPQVCGEDVEGCKLPLRFLMLGGVCVSTKVGIAIEISTTDFDEAVNVVEQSFDLFDQEGWKAVKASRDMNELAHFLEVNDIENKIFYLSNK